MRSRCPGAGHRDAEPDRSLDPCRARPERGIPVPARRSGAANRAAVRRRRRSAALPGGLLEGPGKSGRAAGAVESRPATSSSASPRRAKWSTACRARAGPAMAPRRLRMLPLRHLRMLRNWTRSSHPRDLRANRPREPADGAARRRRRRERDCAIRGILPPSGRGADNALAGRRCGRDRAIRGILPRTGRASAQRPRRPTMPRTAPPRPIRPLCKRRWIGTSAGSRSWAGHRRGGSNRR